MSFLGVVFPASGEDKMGEEKKQTLSKREESK